MPKHPLHIALRKARLKRKLTQEDIANILHTSQANYNRCESGKQQLSLDDFTTLLLLYYDDKEFQKQAAMYRHHLFQEIAEAMGISNDKLFREIIPLLLAGLQTDCEEKISLLEA